VGAEADVLVGGGRGQDCAVSEAKDGDAETALRGWCCASGASISEDKSLSDDDGEISDDDIGDESVEYGVMTPAIWDGGGEWLGDVEAGGDDGAAGKGNDSELLLRSRGACSVIDDGEGSAAIAVIGGAACIAIEWLLSSSHTSSSGGSQGGGGAAPKMSEGGGDESGDEQCARGGGDVGVRRPSSSSS
jgi:hypothetical protein